jgi:hypothetical protein
MIFDDRGVRKDLAKYYSLLHGSVCHNSRDSECGRERGDEEGFAEWRMTRMQVQLVSSCAERCLNC